MAVLVNLSGGEAEFDVGAASTVLLATAEVRVADGRVTVPRDAAAIVGETRPAPARG